MSQSKQNKKSTAKAPTRRRKNKTGTLGFMVSTFSPAKFSNSSPFPPTMRKKFKYVEIYQMSTQITTGVFGTQQVMRLNSLYDPDQTGSGHQPYGYDEMSAAYISHRVQHCYFRLTFTTPGNTNDMICACTLSPGTSSSLSNVNPNIALERPNIIQGHLSSSGERKCVIQGKVNISQICGVSQQKYNAGDIYVGTTTSDPTQNCLLTFSVASYSGAGSQACSVLVELEYDAILFNRVVLSQS